MHELGIVFHISKQVEQVAAENNVSHVSEVVLQVGEVSSVIPEYLMDCWEWNCKKTPLLRECKLRNEPIKAITFCEGCKSEYPTLPHGKICPSCGSEETYLVTGNEVLIKEIVCDEEDD